MSKLAKPAVFIVALFPSAWIAWQFFHDKLGANPIRELEIQTGLWTLRFLAITLSITPARRAFGWNGLAKYRRMLGLFTFFYACVHLRMWSFVDWFFAWGDMWQEILKHKYILIGMLTWLIILPLAITSTKGWVRRLGKRWAKLHRLVYVAAITGTDPLSLGREEGHVLPARLPRVFVFLLGYRAHFRAAETRLQHSETNPRIGSGIVPSSARTVFDLPLAVMRTVYVIMSAAPWRHAVVVLERKRILRDDRREQRVRRARGQRSTRRIGRGAAIGLQAWRRRSDESAIVLRDGAPNRERGNPAFLHHLDLGSLKLRLRFGGYGAGLRSRRCASACRDSESAPKSANRSVFS